MTLSAVRPLLTLLVLASAVALFAAALPGAPADAVGGPTSDEPIPAFEEAQPVHLVLPDAGMIPVLESAGTDIDHDVRPREGGGIEVTAVVTSAELDVLLAAGARRADAVADVPSPGARARSSVQAQADGVGMNILRADWFTDYSGTFVSIEAKAAVDTPDEARALTVTATVDGEPITLTPFIDAGVYLYHRTSTPRPVEEAPSDDLVVTVEGGGTDSQPFAEWLPTAFPVDDADYQEGFHDRYLDAFETTAKIEALAAEFPDLAEIIELPYETNGYRRQAQVLLGSSTASAFYATTHAWGHEGGNDWTIDVVDPGAPDAPLTVDADGTAITVSLATDGEGALSSTAAEVAAALDSELGDVLEAHTYRGNAGEGIVEPGSAEFSDNLSAPASVSREPFTMKAIRIGRHRDGSRLGVLGYAQEHAREWQTPLVALETAERLLRNYRTDSRTRRLVDHLDIFIIPTMNPDGTNYSMYDFNNQRKNMTNHCAPNNADPNRRNSWGVDLNRNHSVGSYFDGYDGGSGSCTSGTSSGPGEHSEPEARNQAWLVDTFDHIAFSMNIHSAGGLFMWSPGAYIEDGRIPLPRPSLGVEDYFYASSDRILTAIKQHRGTVVQPGKTGPLIDVLYSAAGNSADQHFYDSDVIAWNFEVSADVWDGSSWERIGWQPEFPEAADQAMEFSDGLIEMFAVALDYAGDRRAPRSSLVVTETGEGEVGFTFDTTEPATVYYTVDGSAPTWDSPTLEAEYLRDGPETITGSEGATVRWFSVDMVGNVERSYDPDRGRGAPQRQEVRAPR